MAPRRLTAPGYRGDTAPKPATLADVLERWTGVVLRHRVLVLACWLVVVGLGLVAAAQLPSRLSVSFSVPGSESDRARRLLADHFGEQPEGTFLVVFDVSRSSPQTRRRLRQRLGRAAEAVPTGRAGRLQPGDGVLYAPVTTALGLADAKGHTDDIRAALAGAGPRAYVTGEPAIQHDLDPVVRDTRRRAELIAIPIALAVIVALFGLTPAVLIPLMFAACTIAGALATLRLVVEVTETTTYVTTFVELLGLGLAIDYSLLTVDRYRAERSRSRDEEHAITAAMGSAGRTVIASGLVVAASLSMLLFVPVPLIRSLGVGGLLVPLIAIVAVLTLQPVLLSLLGGARAPGRGDGERRFWTALAGVVTRRPVLMLALSVGALVVLAIPAASLNLTPGTLSGVSARPEAMAGFARLRDAVGPGAVTPIQIVVEAGRDRVEEPPTRPAVDRLADQLFRDDEVLLVASGARKPYVDGTMRFARVIVVGRDEVGADATQQLVTRIRNDLVPAARFPEGVRASVGGAPAQGRDFVDEAYAALPWIVLLMLGVTFVVLIRALRSLVLPLQAVLLNLLTVAAVCGVLTALFQWGLGESLGLPDTDAIEGWVPLLLFATLFGLSTDYEIFLVSRMREAWDEHHDTPKAVATGLARSGRIVTAAAVVMVAAFAGYAAGQIVGIQQLGLGLALGVLIDAVLVRMIVLPAAVALLGPSNWWLPASVARLVRVQPSPLVREREGRP